MNYRGLLVCCTVGMLPTTGMYAADDGDSSKYIEEIVVTAEKREESILDVPLTMSAFGERMIEQLGMTNSDDLEQMVPGLQFGADAEAVGHGTVIRGIGSFLHGETHSDLAVATYVDGVYTTRTTGLGANFFDVERIEVARGPQGTLNGRNSIAGSISFHTKKPTDYWDVNILAELTDQTTQRLNVAFGGPLTENFSFRTKLGVYSGDGAQKNYGPGGDYDEPDEKDVALQLRWQNDNLDFNLSYSDYEDTGAPRTEIELMDRPRDNPFDTTYFEYDGIVPSVQDCPNSLISADGIGDFFSRSTTWEFCDDYRNEINVNRPGVKDNNRQSYRWSADWQINESYSLRYTGSDSELHNRASRDSDESSNLAAGDSELQIPYDSIEESHELQLFTNFNGPFNMVAGIFHYENETNWEVDSFDYNANTAVLNGDAAALAATGGGTVWLSSLFELRRTIGRWNCNMGSGIIQG